jgi:hypothetical protein
MDQKSLQPRNAIDNVAAKSPLRGDQDACGAHWLTLAALIAAVLAVTAFFGYGNLASTAMLAAATRAPVGHEYLAQLADVLHVANLVLALVAIGLSRVARIARVPTQRVSRLLLASFVLGVVALFLSFVAV